MIELDFIVAHGLEAPLADLAVSPHHLDHDVARDVPAMPAALLRLREGLGDEEHGADVAEHVARQFTRVVLAHSLPTRRVTVIEDVDQRENVLLALDLPLLEEAQDLPVTPPDLSEMLGRLRGERKLLDDRPVGAVLQLPAGLAHLLPEFRLTPRPSRRSANHHSTYLGT